MWVVNVPTESRKKQFCTKSARKLKKAYVDKICLLAEVTTGNRPCTATITSKVSLSKVVLLKKWKFIFVKCLSLKATHFFVAIQAERKK